MEDAQTDLMLSSLSSPHIFDAEIRVCRVPDLVTPEIFAALASREILGVSIFANHFFIWAVLFKGFEELCFFFFLKQIQGLT